MKRNVEIKARTRDLPGLAERAKAIADSGPIVLFQEDTFYLSPRGRLKLRKFSDTKGELIFYERPDNLEPAECRYFLTKTPAPNELHDVLSRAFGIRGRVNKRRAVYLTGQTRIHLDDVEGLGQFVELEVVLEPGQGRPDGVDIAFDLMDKLAIAKEDLLEGAYIDLIEELRGHSVSPETDAP